MVSGADDTGGDGDDQCHQDTADTQGQGAGHTLHDHVEHRLTGLNGHAPVALEEIADPGGVLLQQRLVQAPQGADIFHLLGGRVLAKHDPNGVTGYHLNDKEHQYTNKKGNGDDQCKSFGSILKHFLSPLSKSCP